VYIFEADGQCDINHIGNGAKQGRGSVCISLGGTSWQVPAGDGCAWKSWSGRNCRGSSHRIGWEGGCQMVPFGSIQVTCD
jgi:hypothetical protein